MSTGITQSPPQSTGGDRNDDARAKAADAANQAQEKAQQAASKATDQAQVKLMEQVDLRSAQAAEQINTQASDLRSVSEALREQGKAGPADAADRLAEYAETVGSYLKDKDAHALLADAESFGRQRPWAAAAGGLALGFAASRFLKASSRERYQSRAPRPDSYASTPGPSHPSTPGPSGEST
jgi:hypothetical protein